MKNYFSKKGFLFLAIACMAITASSQTVDELKTKIAAINKEMHKAMVDGNSSVVMGYYANDAVSLPNYGKLAKGIDAIKKSNEEMMAMGMKIISFETTVLMLNTCENMIAEIGTYKMNFTMQGAPSAMEDLGKYITIWEKQSDGSLKIKLEMWNTDNYPMGAGM